MTKLIHVSKSSKAKDQEIVDTYKEENPWGMSVSIDLHQCDQKMIRDEKVIKQFVADLVKHIKMKAYKEPLIRSFGDNPRVAGISAIQLIETSSITMHFANDTNTAHIDIFSCSFYMPHEAGLYCKQYFKAEELTVSPAYFRY